MLGSVNDKSVFKKDRKKHKKECVQYHNNLRKCETNNIFEQMFREQVKQSYSDIQEPHCLICGDTSKLCHLNNISSGEIICDDCMRIQENMYHV